MLMKAEPILKAVAKARGKKKKTKVYILSPNGKVFTDTYAATLAEKYTDIILIAGRYEGIDARVKKILKAEELSVGPYTLTGGELPALVVADAVTRRIPGVLGNESSLEGKRVASREMYTRPETLVYKGKSYRVPRTLLSGNHREIESWRGRRRSSSG
jgi:tRNA (guanine37-N1)-methyltransferase